MNFRLHLYIFSDPGIFNHSLLAFMFLLVLVLAMSGSESSPKNSSDYK